MLNKNTKVDMAEIERVAVLFPNSELSNADGIPAFHITCYKNEKVWLCEEYARRLFRKLKESFGGSEEEWHRGGNFKTHVYPYKPAVYCWTIYVTETGAHVLH